MKNCLLTRRCALDDLKKVVAGNIRCYRKAAGRQQARQRRYDMSEVRECCDTCGNFLTDGGAEVCRFWGEPKENIKEEKCSEYGLNPDLQRNAL